MKPNSGDEQNKRYIEIEQSDEPKDDHSEEQRLLDEVLKETISATSGPDAYALVVEVANRPGNKDITDGHTAEELVKEILRRRMPGWVVPGDLLRHVSDMLLEDPVAKQRLVDLWAEATNHVG